MLKRVSRNFPNHPLKGITSNKIPRENVFLLRKRRISKLEVNIENQHDNEGIFNIYRMLSKSLSINLKMSPLLLFFQILKLGSIPPSLGQAGNCFERTKETGTYTSYFKLSENCTYFSFSITLNL